MTITTTTTLPVRTGPYSPVGDLVGALVVRVSGDRTLEETAMAMREANVSSALVDDGRAIVTERDITRAVAAGYSPTTTVLAVAMRDPFAVPARTTVVAAAAEMVLRDIRHLVVTEGDAIVGVISLRPLLHVLLEAMDPGVWVALRQAVTETTEIWLG
jgi:CBS domain-containing protein